MSDASASERALCCGPTCGRTRPEHGGCVAATYGRSKLAALTAAGFGVYRAEAPNPLPRCGDHVHHVPSGEDWVVAWATCDDIAWAGWPNGMARTRDVRIIRRATDAQHAQAVTEWLGESGQGDSRQDRVRRLYSSAEAMAAGGEVKAAANAELARQMREVLEP